MTEKLYHVVDRNFEDITLDLIKAIPVDDWAFALFRRVGDWKCGELVCLFHDHFEAFATCAALNAQREFIGEMCKYEKPEG